MTTGRVDISRALAQVPSSLREPLLDDYVALLEAYRLGHWETVGLRTGKVCEHVYTILSGYTSGSYPAAPGKPPNMLQACIELEKADAKFGRPVRIQMPRVIVAAYELRNNRAIGHVSGDLNPNHMDAEFLARSAKWLLAELVRIFNGSTTKAAQSLVEAISERSSPLVWSNGDIVRVLSPEMPTKDKAVVILYTVAEPIRAKELCSHVEYKNLSRFRSDVLREMANDKLIEFTPTTDHVQLLPPGASTAEKLINRMSRWAN